MILCILWSRSKKGNASSCPCAQAHVLLVKGTANPLDESEHSLSGWDLERGSDRSRRGHLEPARCVILSSDVLDAIRISFRLGHAETFLVGAFGEEADLLAPPPMHT